ncbi:phage major capsid protein [Brevibacillus laterosporus]|uniref:phage major capsid protein n=1 Tax=Brevibacillus laterosporus TaxID=1465 RepID=UPI003D2082AB
MKKQKNMLFPMNLQYFNQTTTQELLQLRAEKIERQQAIIALAKSEESRDLTEEEDQEFETLESEILEMDNKIEARQKMERREGIVATRTKELGTTATPFRPSALYGGPTQPPQKDDGGFKNLGEFIHAVRFGDTTGRLSELPIGQGQGGGYGVPDAFKGQILPSKMKAQWSMGTDSEGGYAVPDQFRPDVLMINPSASIVRPRATVLPAGDPADGKITMPALDQGSNGVYGGVEVAWIGEGEEKPDTSGKLREVSLQPHEVAATTVVTDKLLRNWVAADSFISSLLTKAMNAAEDIACLSGDGSNKPTGIITAKGSITVNREAAGKVTYTDVVMMLAKLNPESLSDAVWVANQSILPDIVTLQDPSGKYIFIQGDATKGIPSTLAGIPIQFTGRTPARGQKGDLVLVDLKYYLIKDGSGPYIAASEHVLFRQNKTVIKVFWNMDGKPWVIEPLLLEDKVTKVSPYVVLDVPKV